MTVADSTATATERRRERRASVMSRIKINLVEFGKLYRPTEPYRRHHEGPGWIIKASSLRNLHSVLELRDESQTQFLQAAGYLMYKEGVLVRTHIDGERHFKLLIND